VAATPVRFVRHPARIADHAKCGPWTKGYA
jgi:hypothetical protein